LEELLLDFEVLLFLDLAVSVGIEAALIGSGGCTVRSIVVNRVTVPIFRNNSFMDFWE
jgi:hypothetical protein